MIRRHSSRRWQDEAACAGLGREDFIPEYPLTDHSLAGVAAAKLVCAGCPVKSACLSYAHRHGASGVWGGVLLAGIGGVGRPRKVS